MNSERYVIGHTQPDTDTIVSAIGYAHLKQQQGEAVTAARCGELNPETVFVLDHFGVEPPVLLEDATDHEIVLVDHNEYSQTASGMRAADIVGVIDHHRLGDVETSAPITCRIEPLGSTATLLVQLYDEADVDIPDDIAGLLLSGLLSDTVVLRSPTTTETDRLIAERLADQIGEDIDAFGRQLLQRKSQLGEKTPREMVLADFKEFDFGVGTVGIGQVETVSPEQVLDQSDAVLTAMQDIVAERGYTFLTLIVTDVLEQDSTGLFVGDHAETYANALDTTLEAGICQLPGVMSRKKQVVPPLEDAFTEA